MSATPAKVAWLGAVLAGIAVVSFAGRAANLATRAARAAAPSGSSIQLIALPNGGKGIADAGGQVVPLRDYRRIASGSTVADDLLLALAEPERIVALTDYGRTHYLRGYLYGKRPALTGPVDLERLRELHVDLVVLNHFGPPAELARMRETGAQVFNLGEMRGLRTLLTNAEAVAILLGDRARGVELGRDLQRRMRAVAADIPASRRKRALYTSAYGGQLFGGTAGTSYHDVLSAAGLIDVAATGFVDWPHYDPEQLLALDPEIIVTSDASVPMLCRISGLDHLQACSGRNGGRIIGLNDVLLLNPGLGMLDAAEALRAEVYGPIE